MSWYYKVVGYGAHTIRWFGYDKHTLESAITDQNSPFWIIETNGDEKNRFIELIFGVRYSGATDLLMTHEQMVTWAKQLKKPRLQSPYHLSDFESLSPLWFTGLSHLQVVFKSYEPLPKKGISGDHSQANRDFSTPGNDSGLVRARYEHGRNFYRILRGKLDLQKFGLRRQLHPNMLRLIVLGFNILPPELDERSHHEKFSDPKITDIAWGAIEMPGLVFSLSKEKRRHFFLPAMRLVPKISHQGQDDTQIFMDLKGIAQELHTTILSNHQDCIVLVWKQARTFHALHQLHVNTSGWQTGIESILGLGSHADHSLTSTRRQYSRTGHVVEPSHLTHIRPRSRSPRPHTSHELNTHSSPQHTSHSAHHGIFHVVDVHEMFNALMPTIDRDVVDELSYAMKFFQRDGHGTSATSADDQCHQILDIWLSMVQGSAIDDQRKWQEELRTYKDILAVEEQSAQKAMARTVPSSFQDDRYNQDDDPNDFGPTVAGPSQQSAYDDDDEGNDIGFELDDD